MFNSTYAALCRGPNYVAPVSEGCDVAGGGAVFRPSPLAPYSRIVVSKAAR